MYKNLIKPTIDKTAALIGLLFTLPVTLMAALSLAIAQRGKIFFIQSRPGKDEKIFRLIKFKTMTDEKDEQGRLLPDEDRLTKAGRIVRKTSIDELPQLINILKGDMSLIGPRPLLIEYLPLYNEDQKRRHEVKPGITGWAQINGRNSLSWPDKFRYDVWYVNNLSFRLDMKILFLTIIKVFKAEGISGEGSATMERFRGEVISQKSKAGSRKSE